MANTETSFSYSNIIEYLQSQLSLLEDQYNNGAINEQEYHLQCYTLESKLEYLNDLL